MKVHGINQDKAVIENILYKNVNVGIIANSDLSCSHQTLELKGTWTGVKGTGQVVYGVTLFHLLQEAVINNEQFIVFKKAFSNTYKLIEVFTGYEIQLFHNVKVSGDIDDNYSEFDGIKFQLVN